MAIIALVCKHLRICQRAAGKTKRVVEYREIVSVGKYHLCVNKYIHKFGRII